MDLTTRRPAAPEATNATVDVLREAWLSWGEKVAPSVIYFFHQDHARYGAFSNFYRHGEVSCRIPTECGGAALEAAGRSAKIDFCFAEKAIMAFKAALFLDFDTFDEIMRADDPMVCKKLGRKVSGFVETTWMEALLGVKWRRRS